MSNQIPRPSAAFISASWAALILGTLVYMAGLWNSTMQLNEKGFYFVVLMYGLFAAISLQKSVRDRVEGLRVSEQYYSICWVSLFICMALLVVGLWNASMALSEKGFYAMAFMMCLFGAVAVQKNTRDILLVDSTLVVED